MKKAIHIITDEKNTLFDDLIKNLENIPELYSLVFQILIEGAFIQFNIYNPVIEHASILGIVTKKNTQTKVANAIFELIIYNYMISKKEMDELVLVRKEYSDQLVYNVKLNMELALNKFQEIMKDEYRGRDSKFVEREGRLLFLCFLKPLINGKGFYYVEPETREDSRMDIIVTYGNEEHIIELKIWRGEQSETKALDQLSGYLES